MILPEQFPGHEALFNELVARAKFDIIHAVHAECAGWESELQGIMVCMIVEQIAFDLGIREPPKDEEESEAE